MLLVLAAAAVLLVGLGLIGLGVHFMWLARPYRRLLMQAGVEVVETYRGWRRGDRWEILINIGSQTEKVWVEGQEMGRFLLRRALGRRGAQEQAMATAIEEVAAEGVADRLLYEWAMSGQGDGGDKKIRDEFSSSRREVLITARDFISAQVALRARATA